jgi:DNA repair protein RadA
MVNIKDLTQLPGVGQGTAEKMQEGGILNLMSVAVCTPSQLKDACGITEKSARKVIQAARDLCEIGFNTGTQVEENKLGYIPTYCESVDKLLGGGLELGSTMEAFGQFAVGKTALSHILAVSTIKNYPDSYVVWIDTEATFKPERIRQICKHMEVDADKALSQILHGKALTSDHQILLTEKVEELSNNDKDVKLLIIDSLMNHFRAEYLGRGTLAGRQQMLNGYLHRIGKLADIYKIAVYMTNQVQSDPGCMFGNPEKVVGGNIVQHFAETRVWLIKAAKETRKMKLVDSPHLPIGEAVYKIVEGGFESIES